jgi:hypothetical protein
MQRNGRGSFVQKSFGWATLEIRLKGGIVKDEILEKWYTMPLKTKQEILDKFNVTTLQGVMENEKLRAYVKANFMRSKLIRRES